MAILALSRSLDAPVTQLRDVGPTTSRLLTRLGIRTVRDLLLTLPFRCETYAPSPTSALAPRRKVRFGEATGADDGGTEMRVVWFHSPFVLGQLKTGDRVMFAGQVDRS